jgi:hypothetical protein
MADQILQHPTILHLSQTHDGRKFTCPDMGQNPEDAECLSLQTLRCPMHLAPGREGIIVLHRVVAGIGKVLHIVKNQPMRLPAPRGTARRETDATNQERNKRALEKPKKRLIFQCRLTMIVLFGAKLTIIKKF